MKKNAFYAQSGGVTSVINATAAAVIQEAKKYPNHINKVEPALFGWHGHKNPFEFNLNYLPSSGIEKMKKKLN